MPEIKVDVSPSLGSHGPKENESYFGKARLAAKLEDALFDIRSFERTRNWLTGYSLAEALNDRIRHIGTRGGKQIEGGRYTQIGQLEALTQSVADIVDGEDLVRMMKEEAPSTGPLEV